MDNNIERLYAEFDAYWVIWRLETVDTDLLLQKQRNEELMRQGLQDDPLLSTGLLTTRGILSYRTYVPIGTETNQLNGEQYEEDSAIPADS